MIDTGSSFIHVMMHICILTD